ncbi:hypothetical protein MHYP_G00345550 [Metynnis hypsauchen]
MRSAPLGLSAEATWREQSRAARGARGQRIKFICKNLKVPVWVQKLPREEGASDCVQTALM